MRPPSDPAALIARLSASRLRLRQALVTSAASSEASAPRDQAYSAFPGVGLLAGMLRDWWRQHPLQIGGRLGFDLAQRLMKPAVGRHPVMWVLGSALAGALVWRARPWRWLLRSVLLYGLLPSRPKKPAGSPWPMAILMMSWLLKRLPTQAEAAEVGQADRSPRPAVNGSAASRQA